MYKQPFAVIGYMIPGAQTKNEHLLDVVALILGAEKDRGYTENWLMNCRW